MGRKGRRLRKLTHELAQRFPHLDDPEATIVDGQVLVDGFPVKNPASLVPVGVALALREPAALRGETKLRHAIETFGVDVTDRVAVDIGAAAGGFTRVLIEAGARRVYAVDAGHGQLLGSLRQDRRVVNLERTNLGDLTTGHVPDQAEVITVDLSYLALAHAAPQIAKLRIAPGADLIALVKPIYELRTGVLPTSEDAYQRAVTQASRGLSENGWRIVGTERSPVRGGRGAVEWLLHGRWA